MLMFMHAVFARFTFKNKAWVQHLRPGIVPSLRECTTQGGGERHCSLRVWRGWLSWVVPNSCGVPTKTPLGRTRQQLCINMGMR